MLTKLCNWYGGKQRVINQILSLIPHYITAWYEACMGSAVVTLNKVRHQLEMINDLDYELVNLFSLLADRRDGLNLLDRLLCLPYSENEFIHAIRAKRNMFRGLDPFKMAEMTFVMITQSFNATRKNFRRGISTYEYQSGLLLNLPEVYKRLDGVRVRQMDAAELVDKVRDNKNAFCLLDVPYLHQLRGASAHDVYGYEMSLKEHIRMLEVIRDAKCRIMLCGYRNPNGNDLYDRYLLGHGWNHYLLAELVKSCQFGHRTNDIGQEWVWLNYTPPESAKYHINLTSAMW